MDNNETKPLSRLKVTIIDVHVKGRGQETLTYLETSQCENVETYSSWGYSMGNLGGVEKFDAVWMTQNNEVVDATRFVVGQVKWFDAVKGFGFVVADEGGPDILLHANVLRNFGQGSVADASKVELRVQETDRGFQAIEVLSIVPPILESDDGNPIVGLAPEQDVEMIPARVKWFDKGKGFGFANAYGSSDDIFLHIEVLHRCGLADLLAGEAVCLRVVDGERGKMAAEVHAWDHAITHS